MKVERKNKLDTVSPFSNVTEKDVDLLLEYFSALENAKRSFKKHSKFLGVRQECDRLDIGGVFEHQTEIVDYALQALSDALYDYDELISS